MDREERRVLRGSIAELKGIIAGLRGIYKEGRIRSSSFKEFFSAFMASNK